MVSVVGCNDRSKKKAVPSLAWSLHGMADGRAGKENVLILKKKKKFKFFRWGLDRGPQNTGHGWTDPQTTAG